MRRLSNTLRVRRTLCIALLAVLLLSISCDRDCPTQPPPPLPPVDNGTNFYVLFRGAGHMSDQGAIYVYNTKQQVAVDSFLIEFDTDYRDIEITADEKYILIGTTGGSTSSMIIDVATHELIAPPVSGPAVDWEVSPNGKFIAAQGGAPLLYLDAITFDIVATDSGAGAGGAWDSTGNVFYSVRWRGDATFIRRFDLLTETALPGWVAHLSGGFPSIRFQSVCTSSNSSISIGTSRFPIYQL